MKIDAHTWVDGLMHDVRCAFRSMRRFPVATAVAIASLAAGIGATAATLTIRNAVFRNAPPLYRDPAQLTRLRLGGGRTPAALYERWREVLGANVAEIGRASCRERGESSVVAVSLRKKRSRRGDRTSVV